MQGERKQILDESAQVNTNETAKLTGNFKKFLYKPQKWFEAVRSWANYAPCFKKLSILSILSTLILNYKTSRKIRIIFMIRNVPNFRGGFHGHF